MADDYESLEKDFFKAISAKSLSQMESCLTSGVDVNCKLEQSGRSPLHCAIENDYFEGFMRIIDSGGDINGKSLMIQRFLQ